MYCHTKSGVMKRGYVCVIMLLIASCGVPSDGIGNSFGLPDFPDNLNPVVVAPDDTSTTDVTLVVTPTIFDDDGDELQVTWSLIDGPASAVLIRDENNDGIAQITFPINGAYVLQVSANDGRGGISTDIMTVNVNVAQDFRLFGSVEDGTSGSRTGTNGVECKLYWTLAGDEIVIVRSQTVGGGQFQYANLLGSVADFAILIAAGSG